MGKLNVNRAFSAWLFIQLGTWALPQAGIRIAPLALSREHLTQTPFSKDRHLRRLAIDRTEIA